ncbi:hypothetical protein P7K49_013059 [Saguinus oedipus]|uniref:Uncharacterized protein n=1 Tax=Saguinus oedipus TaxID=9490 RepID=A0ABQ9VEU5_SAGOE|nr:hypothetical protein P7K49_013059 [Saguinus oedipus]
MWAALALLCAGACLLGAPARGAAELTVNSLEAGALRAGAGGGLGAGRLAGPEEQGDECPGGSTAWNTKGARSSFRPPLLGTRSVGKRTLIRPTASPGTWHPGDPRSVVGVPSAERAVWRSRSLGNRTKESTETSSAFPAPRAPAIRRTPGLPLLAKLAVTAASCCPCTLPAALAQAPPRAEGKEPTLPYCPLLSCSPWSQPQPQALNLKTTCPLHREK